MIVYQVLPRLWGNGRLSDWNEKEFKYLKKLGVTHIWFTGIPRHATGAPYVKGDPGSPYSISDWFDVNPYLCDNPENRLQEFRDLVSRVHGSGLKVITDYIPNHVSPDYNGDIPRFDWCDYDWTDTRKVDWGNPVTATKMLEVLDFWLGLGVDGFRCDMVELVPVNALEWLITEVKKHKPDTVFIGEAYDFANYRPYLDAGFDFLYDKSGEYDSIRSINSGAPVSLLTYNWQRLQDMQPRMLNFLENHDEERLSCPDYASLAAAAAFNDASYLLYFGEEVGESASDEANRRTSIFDFRQPASVKRLCRWIRCGRGLTADEKAVLERYRAIMHTVSRIRSWKNYDLCWCNDTELFIFLRFNGKECLLFACNFRDYPDEYEVVIPEDARRMAGIGTASVRVVAGPHDVSISSC